MRDPECLFAYWEVGLDSLRLLRDRIGERVLAVSPLTLRLDEAGRARTIFLPRPARSAYLYARPERLYRAEIGLMLPWGEFHRLAASNLVFTPPTGPSTEWAFRLVSYPDLHEVGNRPGGPEFLAEVERAQGEEATRAGASDAFAPPGSSPTRR